MGASQPVSHSSSLNSRMQIEKELKQVFRKFDANDDKKISAAKLGSIPGNLSYTATSKEIETMIREVNFEGDDQIDLNKFIELNTKDIEFDDVLEDLKEAFSILNIDKNGSISAK